MKYWSSLPLLSTTAFILATSHQTPFPNPINDVAKEPWALKYGLQPDLGFTGPLSFSHLPYSKCLEDPSTGFDIAILGFPFDTTTSYRPGARFGPSGIRHGSRRQHFPRGYSLSWGSGPNDDGAIVEDCGDVPLSQTDNLKAIDQMEVAYSTLLGRAVPASSTKGPEPRGKAITKNDHTIVLPILRSLNKVYGPISVIHFDAHLDTWAPRNTTPASEQERITHGSFFAIAHEEGLIANSSSIHAGIRCKMSGIMDVDHDTSVGFSIISTDDIDDYGNSRVVDEMRKRIGDTPVYLTLDIDVVDPGLAPATGTPEPGGWTTREVKRILRGLTGLNFVGADIVEVAPAYDHADITSIAAADLVHDFLIMMQNEEPPKPHRGPFDDPTEGM